MKKGFTLIELLVVITILAVLAGAALPYVQSYVEEARIAKAKTDLEEVARALAVYEMREGDYLATDVRDLTGRYLNKAPIDPWGKAYYIASTAGVVKTGGPDRDITTEEDNISAPYQPPLALVQAKWVDRNQTGAVDTQNIPDQVQLYFSRQVNATSSDFDTNTELDTIFAITSDASMDNQFVSASSSLLLNKKVLVLTVKSAADFTIGSDSLSIIAGHGTLKDMFGNLAIASQVVKILTQ